MSKRPFIGVATTTPIACQIDNQLLLEPMNILSTEGCGVPTSSPAHVGKIVSVAFRLSSTRRTIYCKASILADVATTPGGLELRQAHGDDAFADAMALRDSATSIVRREDVERRAKAAKSAPPPPPPPTHKTFPTAPSKGPPPGLCLRFIDLGEEGAKLVREHITKSREIEARLLIGNEQASSDRKQGLFFDDPKLSDKANDW